jgi:hypothetical protein
MVKSDLLLLLLWPMLQLPRLLTPIMKFPFCVLYTILLWFRVTMIMRFLSRAQGLLDFTPSLPLPLFVLNLYRRPAAVADALSGMVNMDVLLLTQRMRRVSTHQVQL